MATQAHTSPQVAPHGKTLKARARAFKTQWKHLSTRALKTHSKHLSTYAHQLSYAYQHEKVQNFAFLNFDFYTVLPDVKSEIFV